MSVYATNPEIVSLVQVLGRYSINRGDGPDLLDRCLALASQPPREAEVRPAPAPRRLRDRLTDADRSAIVAAYVTGTASMVSLADRYGVSDYSIRVILRRAGIFTNRRLAPETVALVRNLGSTGASVAEIARQAGIAESTVRLFKNHTSRYSKPRMRLNALVRSSGSPISIAKVPVYTSW